MRRRYSLIRQPWRKLLYIQQPFPDNHTDSSFLSQLKRNSTVLRHSFWKLCFDSTLISAHLGLLALIGLVFLGMLEGKNEIEMSLGLTILISSMMIHLIISKDQVTKKNFFKILKSSLLITLSILTLSPVLKSLSESTSSDSIWSLSFWLTCLNIILNDYQFNSTDNNNLKGFLGMNILIFNVVLLASRLKTNLQVFCFILFSFEISCFLPLLINNLRLKIEFNLKNLQLRIYLLIIVFLHSLNCFLISINFNQNFIIGIIGYLFLNFCVLVCSPLYFLMLQKYKDELQGPWDIAQPVI